MGEADIPIPEIMRLYIYEEIMECIEGCVKSWRLGESPELKFAEIKILIKSFEEDLP